MVIGTRNGSTSDDLLPPAPPQDSPRSVVSLAAGLLATAVIVAGLYFGRDLLMPLALAILLGFVLDPLVTRLRRWHWPRALAVAVVVCSTLATGAATVLFVAHQARGLAAELPVYQSNVSAKLKNFRQRLQDTGILRQLSQVTGVVERELDAAQRDLEARSRSGRPAATQRVEVIPTPPTAAERLVSWLQGILEPLATAGIVIVFLVLILLDTGDLRDRLLRLLGGNLHRTTDALAEAGRRVSRYLTMQLVVNVTYGVPLALGLWILGVPGAILWGLVAALLRFVPYAGPVVAAVFPLLLAFAVDPGWSALLWAAALIVTLELVSNNLVEPWLYGATTGVSPLSLILAALFWTAIWGPAGLVMAAPITVVLMVMGRHLPQLQFLDVLLGSRPALDAPTRLYQRLLAGDAEEAVDLAGDLVEASSPQAFYDDVALPALCMATEAHRTLATTEHRLRIVSGMERVIADLRAQHPVDEDPPTEVLCLGLRWEVDALAAEMAAHALALAGHRCRAVGRSAEPSDPLARLDLGGARMVCLSTFAAEPSAQARAWVRRLKLRQPNLRIVLAPWNALQPDSGTPLLQATGVDTVVGSIAELVAGAEPLLAGETAPPYVPAAVPDDDRERVRALHACGALDEGSRAALDALARRAADVFDTALAQVTLIDAERQIVQGSSAPAAGPAASLPREQSVCAHAVAGGGTLVVPDVLRDPRFAANPWLKSLGMRFYAGAPLRHGPHLLGALCLLDTRPRALTRRETLLLEAMADDAAAILVHAADAPSPQAA